ncbi:MAG TPA: hypothetical protein VF762_07765, partial [Blastocatellia bacterium]
MQNGGQEERQAVPVDGTHGRAAGESYSNSTTKETVSPGGASLIPSISLPKGGGAIRGMGEKFEVNPATGTGALMVPL